MHEKKERSRIFPRFFAGEWGKIPFLRNANLYLEILEKVSYNDARELVTTNSNGTKKALSVNLYYTVSLD